MKNPLSHVALRGFIRNHLQTGPTGKQTVTYAML